MLLRCHTEINIQQQGAGRSRKFLFSFCNEFEATDTWVDLTNQATVKLPKNVYVRDQNNKLIPLAESNIGGFDQNPLFLRGDKISISFGYRYFRDGNEILETAICFVGFITEVISKKPFELKCEDNMYKLKQIPARPQVWKGSVESLFVNLLKDFPEYKVNQLTTTTIGPIVIGNESVAQLLERLRKDANLESYFRGNELRVGAKVYIDSEAVDRKFVFQKNIISDDLAYKRKDDIILSAIVISRFESFTGQSTKDGSQKTKRDNIEILVYWDKSINDWKYIKKKKGVEFPSNLEGERRTLNYVNITDEKTLFNNGVDDLKKYFYTGFKGKFVTFGIPFVKQGDNVFIEDSIIPERNGKYKVRGVNYSGGIGGHRQEIILDYKIE